MQSPDAVVGSLADQEHSSIARRPHRMCQHRPLTSSGAAGAGNSTSSDAPDACRSASSATRGTGSSTSSAGSSSSDALGTVSSTIGDAPGVVADGAPRSQCFDEARTIFGLAWPQSTTQLTSYAPGIVVLASVGHLEGGAVLVGAAGVASMYSQLRA